ncbi:WD-40 repeat protein [Planomonospora sphaerica]|uniref:WD-40 repeat protein n=1 Tax=Planomonospora sphaerica TaxID=161355 RepID=A0A171DNU9_9ACTN|nr:PD40 domain-containing protein [Planomonospora sphaerica]GAT70732.1 WD-40 repeat protein [Planomonospora sphaerica]
MPRPERPLDPEADALQRFAWELRLLRRQAGNPGYRELARKAHYSATTLAQAARGEKLPSLAVTLAYVQACGGDTGRWRERWHRVAGELDVPSAEEPGDAAAGDGRAPYRGLAAFQPEDARHFHGREKLVGELVARLVRHPFLALFGPSGAGKSSLLRAGLLPGVQDPGQTGGRAWRTLLMTPGAHPLQEYTAVLATVTGTPKAEAHAPPGTAGRNSAEAHAPPGTAEAHAPPDTAGRTPAGDVLLVVDQFEEVFTLCRDPEERTRFIAALLAATRAPDAPVRVVLGVRADFYAHCADHPELAAALTDAQILLGPMTTEELRQAITRPARDTGCTVEGALLATIIADTAGQPGALPLISHALLETWRRRRGNTLTLAGYQAAGGIHGALAKTAETLHTTLGPVRQARAKDLFLRLTAPGEGTGDTGRRITRDELDLRDPDTLAVLDLFAGARLITLGDDTVEIAHEALIRAWPRLHRWLAADREGLRTRHHLTQAARTWISLDRDPGALYRGARLAVAREWAAHHDRRNVLNDDERAFLDASIRLEDTERARAARRSRQLRRLAAALTILLLIATGTGVVAIREWRDAEHAHRTALSRQLAAQALTSADSEPETAMLLAAEAFTTEPTTEARGALLSTSPLHAHHGTLTGHTGAVSQVLFAPDGRTLYSVGRDRTVAVWDARRRTRSAALAGHDTWLKAAALSPDGRVLATGGEDGALVLWDAAAGARVAVLTEHTAQIREIAFSPDGRTVATAADDTTVVLWDVAARTRLATLTGHTGKARGVAFSPDGRTLATSGDDAVVVLWDVAARTRLATLTGHTETAGAVAFSPDGRVLATAGADTTVILWDTATRTRLATFTHRREGQIIALAFSPDGRTLATSGHDPAILLWDVGHRTLRGRLTGHRANVYTLAFSPGEPRLASAGEDGDILLWDTTRPYLARHDDQVDDAVFSPDGRTLATTSAGRTTVWNSADRTLREVRVDRSARVNALAFSPDGRVLATATEFTLETRGNTVTLWISGRDSPVVLAGHTGHVLDLAFSPDGRVLATASADTTVMLWDTATHRRLATLTGHSLPVNGVAFSPDGRILASAGHDPAVMLWDVAARRPLAAPLLGHSGWVRTVAFSPDGRTLASAGADENVVLWDVARRTRLAVIPEHADAVTTGAAFSPDGRTLAFTGGGDSVILWDVRRGTRTARLTGHTQPVRALAFAPDGRTLVTAGADGDVLLWDTDPQRVITRICGALARDLTRQEWRRHIPERPYRRTCPAGRTEVTRG